MDDDDATATPIAQMAPNLSWPQRQTAQTSNSKMLCIPHWTIVHEHITATCTVYTWHITEFHNALMEAHSLLTNPWTQRALKCSQCFTKINPLILRAFDVRLRKYPEFLQNECHTWCYNCGLENWPCTFTAHTPGADVNCCAIKDLSNDHCFHWRYSARKITDWVPDFLQISSAKDDDMDPNHRASATAASRKWALAGNELLNHLPSLKRPSGSLCWAAGHRSSDKFGLNIICFKRDSTPNSPFPLNSCW